MKTYLVMLFAFFIFAKGIVGSSYPMTREKLIPPFPFCKDKVIKRISKMRKRLTQDEFISRSKQVHGNKYDYSLVEYVNTKTKVKIVCPTHGVFEQIPKSHLNGHGCPTCGGSKPLTIDDFIKKSISVHGNKYDYSQSSYTNLHSKIKIICREHGAFYQNAHVHMAGFGCPMCSNTARHTTESFIEKAKQVHGDKYDYSKVNYINACTKIHIVCNTCGNNLYVTPNSHLNGSGCSECARQETNKKLKLPISTWIERSRISHVVLYDYSNVKYNNLFDKVEIVCPIHGAFFQEAKSHMEGQNCPLCSNISKGEERIDRFFKENNTHCIRQFVIRNENIFCSNENIFVDFFLPNHNIIIEYNGKQHYESVNYFGGKERFLQQQERDMALRQYCKEHKIKLIEIPYTEYDNIETILKKELKIK